MPVLPLTPPSCGQQVGADKAIQIANYLCPGNYAVSGSIEGCEAVERLGKDPAFKARMTVSATLYSYIYRTLCSRAEGFALLLSQLLQLLWKQAGCGGDVKAIGITVLALAMVSCSAAV